MRPCVIPRVTGDLIRKAVVSLTHRPAQPPRRMQHARITYQRGGVQGRSGRRQ